MLGNLARDRVLTRGARNLLVTIVTIVGALLVVGAGCASTISQDAATGKDGKQKGAKPIVLENNAGKGKGIITYPGGDRVDWKVIDLPEGKTGTLEVKLTWKPPRPGLDLAFEVYDAFNAPVASAKPSRKGRKTSKKQTVENAKGKYFVQVYASNRGDAGTYTLAVEFAENAPPAPPLTVAIPDPPKLPTVPEPPAAKIPCDLRKFDAANPDCANKCPIPPDLTLEACANVCPVPPSAEVKACWPTMPCPTPPNRNVKACKDWPPCDWAKRDPGNPNCDGAPPKVTLTARIMNKTASGSEVIITVDKGENDKVERGWTGQVIDDSGRPVSGGDFVIIKVTKTNSVGKVRLTVDTLNKSPKVRLSSP